MASTTNTPSRRIGAKRPHLTIETLSASSPARSTVHPPGVVPASPSTAASGSTNRSAGPYRTPHSSRSPASASASADASQQLRRKTSLPTQLIPPSPSRSRLDPEYSARLPQQHYQSNNGLMGPPGIIRGTRSAASTPTGRGHMSPFRPPPVSTTYASGSPRSDAGSSVYGTPRTTATAASLFETPRRRPSSAYSPSRTFFGTPASSARSSYAASPVGTPRGSPRGTPRRERFTNITGGRSDTGYSDRFIPSRATSNLKFSVWGGDSSSLGSSRAGTAGSPDTSGNSANDPNPNADAADARTRTTADPATQQPILNMLLRSELLGENIDPTPPPGGSPGRPASARGSAGSGRGGNTGGGSGGRGSGSGASGGAANTGTPLREGANFLRFQSPRQTFHHQVFGSVAGSDGPTSVVNSFNLSPVGSVATQRLLSTPQKRKRKIAKVPFKVLDAPALADDFYLNLVDWSAQNVLAVGLGSCVYLWSACTSKVTKLCDLQEVEDTVTSVSWTQKGSHLAIGTNRGEVQIWDTVKCEKVRIMSGHGARTGTLAWCGPTLASGSRDRSIFLRDVRAEQQYFARLGAHKQEVCGLKWSFDEPSHLASGGNDNKLLVWDIKNHSQPVHKFAEHSAAVKAIAWSPHQHGLLASGGGTADRCIRFWNTLSGAGLNCIDTGSQVCNLSWSKNCNEIVSTHGYSLNQIVVWKYPTMSKVATLTGHTYRVLYLAMSPDGSTIVTGAGDETLRFWQVFPGPRSDDKSSATGMLFPAAPGSVIR